LDVVDAARGIEERDHLFHVWVHAPSVAFTWQLAWQFSKVLGL
jgi:hypothetical protein